jgi:deferrochelatase/peroxidase EfeB
VLNNTGNDYNQKENDMKSNETMIREAQVNINLLEANVDKNLVELLQKVLNSFLDLFLKTELSPNLKSEVRLYLLAFHSEILKIKHKQGVKNDG